VIPEIETQIGANLARIAADRGYRGHNAPPDHKLKVYISGQRRRVTETINPNFAEDPRSDRSSDTPNPSTEWDETISPAPTATPPTPSWPPLSTTSDACSNGWLSCCP
jgi:transposase, IS5 family